MANTVVSLFAGAGGIDVGFEQTGQFKTVYANEFDKYACQTYHANFKQTILDDRSIRDVAIDEIKEAIHYQDVDVLTAGFPCQPFSISGFRQGFSDARGDLFFETLRIINGLSPKAIFLENVKNLVTHDNGKTFRIIRNALNYAGYYIKWQVMNSKEYGDIAQNRERIYVVGFKDKQAYLDFKFPEKIPLTSSVRAPIDYDAKQGDTSRFGDLLSDKYFYTKNSFKQFDILKQDMISHETVYQWRRKYVRANKSNVCPTLTANMGTGGHNVPLILNDFNQIRKLTPRETFNVDGYPSDYILPDLSNGRLYKQAGNSVVVPVITRIADEILRVLPVNNTALHAHKEYVISSSEMEGAGCGSAENRVSFDTEQECLDYISDNQLITVTHDEYAKLIKSKKHVSFVTILN